MANPGRYAAQEIAEADRRKRATRPDESRTTEGGNKVSIFAGRPGILQSSGFREESLGDARMRCIMSSDRSTAEVFGGYEESSVAAKIDSLFATTHLTRCERP